MLKRAPWKHDQSRHQRGYGAAWVKLRVRILKRDGYLCQPCLRKGRPTPATEVDHVVPKARGGDDDPSNLQSTCHACHEAKTMIEKGATPRPRVTIGEDGWPV